MKRFHVHVSVDCIEQSAKFYTKLFGAEPTVIKDDYAKWMLNDPCVNFAISVRPGVEPGLDHLGIQADSQDELKELTKQLKSANMEIMDEGNTTCCYAESDKAWVIDPQRIAWETFYTSNTSTVYGQDKNLSHGQIPMAKKSACCSKPQTTQDIVATLKVKDK